MDNYERFYSRSNLYKQLYHAIRRGHEDLEAHFCWLLDGCDENQHIISKTSDKIRKLICK